MKFKHIAAVLAGAAALSAPSCDLNEKFYSEVTPDTFFTSPESTYAVLCRPFTHWKWYIGADRWYLQELTTDEMTCPKRGADWYNGGEYYRLHYHTWSPDDRFVVNTYDGTTGGISRALEAKADLEGVDYNAIGLSDAVKADHINQLNAITAYFYMKGLDYFGGMPIYHSVNDGLRPRNTALETYRHVETLLKNAIPALAKKSSLGAPEDGYIKQAAAAAMLAQLYFNAEAYIGEEHFDECAQICRDIIGGLYGVYELDDTWYGPHTFDNDSSHEAIWNVPSENSKVEWSWYFKYFYHNSSYVYFDIETAGYNGFILTPSLNPQGSYYTQWKLGSPYRKFNDKDLRKKPYRYLGNKRYEGMFLVGKQVNFDDPTKVCLGQKEYSGKVIDMVDQVARFSEVGANTARCLTDFDDGRRRGEFGHPSGEIPAAQPCGQAAALESRLSGHPPVGDLLHAGRMRTARRAQERGRRTDQSGACAQLREPQRPRSRDRGQSRRIPHARRMDDRVPRRGTPPHRSDPLGRVHLRVVVGPHPLE